MEYQEIKDKYGEKALEVHAMVPLGVTPESYGLVPADTVEVGDVAWAYCRGRLRRGIVVRVGRLKASLFYTTDNALRAARQEYAKTADLDIDEECRRREGELRIIWDVSKAAADHPPESDAERGDYGRAVTWIGKNPDREEFVRQAVDRLRTRMTKRKAGNRLMDFINFTIFEARIPSIFQKQEKEHG